MGTTRYRENPRYFFECFCVVQPSPPRKKPKITHKFPEDYTNGELLKWMRSHVYPYRSEIYLVQHFSFTLNDPNGDWMFFFCKQEENGTVTVFLSHLPWHKHFFDLLNTVTILSADQDQLKELLTNLRNLKMPLIPGTSIAVPFKEKGFEINVPSQNLFPSIPEDRTLTEYYAGVGVNNMMEIFASMLFERKIAFTANKLQRVSACVHAANDLIYPMVWQLLFYPVLPIDELDHLGCVIPSLLGVPQELMKRIDKDKGILDDVMIVDADKDKVINPFDDLKRLPQDIVSMLTKSLVNDDKPLIGDAISKAFLNVMIHLIGDYKMGFSSVRGRIKFNKTQFIDKKPPSYRLFLKEFMQKQIFNQFIYEKLKKINNNGVVLDRFEIEARKLLY